MPLAPRRVIMAVSILALIILGAVISLYPITASRSARAAL